MALSKPIISPIAAFDATQEHTIDFVVIGGDQVIANRLYIVNNQTGVQAYDSTQSTMSLSHTIAANMLQNNTYYTATIYTYNNTNEESVASTSVAFYCYTAPTLEITNIPSSTTIENNTYTFIGNYSQLER